MKEAIPVCVMFAYGECTKVANQSDRIYALPVFCGEGGRGKVETNDGRTD